MNSWQVFSLVIVLIFGLIAYSIQDVHALSIFEYASCKNTLDQLKIVGMYTYKMMFGNSEAARFCMYMFENGLTPRDLKDHFDIPKLGVAIDLPENWSGMEINAENMTIAFVTPDKKKSEPIEPLWMMFLITDKSTGDEILNKIYKLVGESLDGVPHFTNTCKFKEPSIIEINDTELEEGIIQCIDRRLSLFVTIASYSFDVDENKIFLISGTRHLPSSPHDSPMNEALSTLKIIKISNSTKSLDVLEPDIKQVDFPNWFEKYITLWGKGKITDKQIIYFFNYLDKNEILNESHYKNPGFHVEQKVPTWFKNNANWFSKGLISDYEFDSGFKYLIKNKIIVV